MGRSLFFVVHFWRILPYGKGKAEVFQNSDGSTKLYQFPMGKVEVLSKSASDWLTVPMQQRSKSGFIRDWLSATAKEQHFAFIFYYNRQI